MQDRHHSFVTIYLIALLRLPPIFISHRQVTILGNSLLALASLAAYTNTNTDFISLQNSGNAWIKQASAILILPNLSGDVTGDFALWSAIMMENQASFLQGVTSILPADDHRVRFCGEHVG